jgi:hypothetical protein
VLMWSAEKLFQEQSLTADAYEPQHSDNETD